MKGIILVAGRGTRMGAATLGITSNGAATSKALLPTYDKPTIYYGMASLIAAGINEILIIAAPDNVNQFRSALGDGDELGITLSYAVQPKPRGIAEAFIIGGDFIGNDDVALTFGDNIFSGHHFTDTLKKTAGKRPDGATIFAYHVENPQDFGVVQFDKSYNVLSLEEKPKHPKSKYAVPGIYFYNSDVVDIASMVTPSARGELEITAVNDLYLDRKKLSVSVLDSDTRWFDTGTPEQTHEAADFVRDYQIRTGRLLGSPEAEAYLSGFISAEQLRERGERLGKSGYGQALIRLAEDGWDN